MSHETALAAYQKKTRKVPYFNTMRQNLQHAVIVGEGASPASRAGPSAPREPAYAVSPLTGVRP